MPKAAALSTLPGRVAPSRSLDARGAVAMMSVKETGAYVAWLGIRISSMDAYTALEGIEVPFTKNAALNGAASSCRRRTGDDRSAPAMLLEILGFEDRRTYDLWFHEFASRADLRLDRRRVLRRRSERQ
jgi:hypothetical protein